MDWVTLALNADVPLKIVRKVTGEVTSFPPLRGKIGGLVVKQYRNQIVVTRAPVFSKP